MRQFVLLLCVTGCTAQVHGETRVPPSVWVKPKPAAAEPVPLRTPSKKENERAKLSPEDLVALCAPSVVVVDTPQRLGAGFFIGPNRVATSLHVVAGQSAITVRLRDGTQHSVDAVDLIDLENDLAVLRVEGAGGQSLRLADSRRLKAGHPITAIGHPRGLEATVSSGIVAAVRSIGNGLQVVQHTAPISLGSSGGPILDERGNVVGIVRGILPSGQALNFAAPSSSLRRLLTQPGPGYSLEQFAQATEHRTSHGPNPIEEDSVLPKVQRADYESRRPERTFPASVAGFEFGKKRDGAAFRCAQPAQQELAKTGHPWRTELGRDDVWSQCPFVPLPLDFVTGSVLMKFPTDRLTSVILEATSWNAAYDRVAEKYGPPNRVKKADKWVPFVGLSAPADVAWVLDGGRILLTSKHDKVVFVSDLDAEYRLHGY